MQKKKKTKPVKNTVRKKKFSKLLIILSVVVLLALCIGAYFGVRLVIFSLSREANLGKFAAATPSPSRQDTVPFPDSEDLSDSFSVSINPPTIIGTKRAIICAELQSEKSTTGTYGFLLRDTLHNTGFEIPAESSGNLIYARTDQLTADTEYLIVAFTTEGDRKQYARDMAECATPKPILSVSQVEDILAKEFPEDGQAFSKEKMLAFETDACLKLMGFDIGDFGTYDVETKSAILMLEYSFTSAGPVCDWRLVTGIFTEPLLNTLKDILSVTPMIDKDTLLKPFTVSAYSLSTYANYGETGAAINCDPLVLDALEQSEAAATFSEYPFVVDSAEFQDKYAGLVNGELSAEETSVLTSLFGRDTLQETSETMLAAIAAKNKVFFSAEEDSWLNGLSGTFETPFTLTGNENNQTAFTLLLPAALAYCYMNDDYKARYGVTMPTTLALRTTLKNWTAYSSTYGKNEVLKFSALWHLNRQQTHAVPGFCLSEYLVSVDFVPADDTIISSDVYRYLYMYASRYGFYPDTAHPYRWIYLGKSVPEETLALSPPPEPLEN